MTTGASDAELVRAHVAGDRAALAAIYDRYAPSLFDTAAGDLGDRDEAADVVQDTFLAAHQHLARLRDPSRLRAWLFAVARHEVARRGRKRRRAGPTATVADMAPSVTPDLDAEVQRTELAAMVRAAAAGLDERDQLVLELSMRQGLADRRFRPGPGSNGRHRAGGPHRRPGDRVRSYAPARRA